MPLPEPIKREKVQDFIDRCMASEIMKREFPNVKQRVAVCYSQARRKRGGRKQKG